MKKEIIPSRKKIMTPKEFDEWFLSASVGDRLVYYRGLLVADIHPESIPFKVWDEYENHSSKINAMERLKTLATHVMNAFGIFTVEEKSCSIIKNHTIELVQRKIRPTEKFQDAYYEYIAVRI